MINRCVQISQLNSPLCPTYNSGPYFYKLVPRFFNSIEFLSCLKCRRIKFHFNFTLGTFKAPSRAYHCSRRVLCIMNNIRLFRMCF